MKNIHRCLFSLSLLILFSTISYGQVKFGIKSGVNIATTKNLITFSSNRIGWYGGGFAALYFAKKYFIQPELLYSSKGNGSHYQVGDLKLITKFNYLNIPLLFGYKIDRRTSLVLGPEFGCLISSQLRLGDQNSDASNTYPKKFDLGLDIGLSYKFIKNAQAEIRYNYGFNTLYSVDATRTRHSEKKGANRVFQIGLNYSLSNSLH
jgi:hypothetical protein